MNDNAQEAEILSDKSPLPPEYKEISFPQAIAELITGKRITRLEWNDGNIYCLLKGDILTIHIRNEFHQWIVNDGDLTATDWITL